MTEQFIEGKWVGHYTYGREYPPSYRRKKEPFTIEIKWENGILIGTCDDIYTKNDFHQSATVQGSFENDHIYFIKKYPGLLTLDENERTIIDRGEESVSIEYSGHVHKKLFSSKVYLKGEWRIDGSFLNEKGEANYYSVTGKWKLEKVKD